MSLEPWFVWVCLAFFVLYFLRSKSQQHASLPVKKINLYTELASCSENYLVDAGKKTTSIRSLEGKVVGLYFSAHWCPPCRSFTPVLAKIYEETKKNGFEVVFVSSDENQEAFEEYLNEMPWKAVPWIDRKMQKKLGDVLDVQGIPTLALFNESGDLVTLDGRSWVQTKKFPFTK